MTEPTTPAHELAREHAFSWKPGHAPQAPWHVTIGPPEVGEVVAVHAWRTWRRGVVTAVHANGKAVVLWYQPSTRTFHETAPTWSVWRDDHA